MDVDTATLGMLASALAIGFFGSTHCIGMCGGIAGALGQAAGVGPGERGRRTALQIGYSVGRIASYCIAGAIAGSFGFLAGNLLGSNAGLILRGLAGLFLVGVGLYVAGWWMSFAALEKLGAVVWNKIQPFTKNFVPLHSPWKAILAGMLWGWLPCGLVYSTLAWAISQGNWKSGALCMLFFGLGTVPAMLAVGSFAQEFSRWLQRDRVRRVSGLLILLFGLWTLVGAGLSHRHAPEHHNGAHGQFETEDAPHH